MLSKAQQADFDAMVHEVAERVKAKEFPNTSALSAAFGRERSWAAFMMHTVVERFKLLTIGEWQMSFSERFVKVHQWQCPRCQYRGKLQLKNLNHPTVEPGGTLHEVNEAHHT